MFEDSIKQEINTGNLIDVLKFKFHSSPYEVKNIINKKTIKEDTTDKILYPRIDLGKGKLGYGKDSGGKGIHIDNPQRLVSILFYLGGYKKIKGGELRLWEKKDNKLIVKKIINPKPNLLIASLQSNESFHDVNPVKFIDGSRNAFYIAISSNINIWDEIENNEFNMLHNKNRVYKKNNLLKKIISSLKINFK